MKRKHKTTLEKIYARPVSGTINWADIESLFVALGGEISEREGSRVGIFLFKETLSKGAYSRPFLSIA